MRLLQQTYCAKRPVVFKLVIGLVWVEAGYAGRCRGLMYCALSALTRAGAIAGKMPAPLLVEAGTVFGLGGRVAGESLDSRLRGNDMWGGDDIWGVAAG